MRTTNENHRIAKISSQKQVRIPRDLYDAYGFDSEAEIVPTETGIELRPVKTSATVHADLLESLIKQGLSGDELIAAFREETVKADKKVSYSVVSLQACDDK